MSADHPPPEGPCASPGTIPDKLAGESAVNPCPTQELADILRRLNDDAPPKPRRTWHSILGTAGMLLVTMLAAYIAFMATCVTVGIATGFTGEGGFAIAIVLGVIAGGFTLMAIVNSYWWPKKP